MKQLPHVQEYCNQVLEVIGTDKTPGRIEQAYDSCIVHNEITKSYFLRKLLPINQAVFDATVDHLFTPINWSKIVSGNGWGIRNTTTGKLIKLTLSGQSEGKYELGDCRDVLDFGIIQESHEEADKTLSTIIEIFGIQKSKEASPVLIEFSDSDEDEDYSSIIVTISKDINPKNLEVCPISVYYG